LPRGRPDVYVRLKARLHKIIRRAAVEREVDTGTIVTAIVVLIVLAAAVYGVVKFSAK
jgi:hypothetical protein